MALLRKLLFLGFLAVFVVGLLPLNANAVVNVKGYYRSNGTYVAPHVRSNPNGLKYDNYSWEPSQGLYNDSYGTRDAYWDTPTYITDPDYYVGQSLYNSNSFPYTPTYTPAPVNKCPLNSSPSQTDSTKCNCNIGYSANFTKDGCTSIQSQNLSCSNTNGTNVIWDGTYTNEGRLNCTCIKGYQWNNQKASCVLPEVLGVTTETSRENLINSIIAQIAALQAMMDRLNSGAN
jgi:hypothetical protein